MVGKGLFSANRVFRAWGAGKNVLLYGPPGTGKTRVLSELYDQIQTQNSSKQTLIASSNDPLRPLSFGASTNLEIPSPIKAYWATFHQSFGYEDFVLGYRPKIENGSVALKAHAGILLDAVLELSDPSSKTKSVVIFIDEINRANASRVFGEFMTFLDFEYREHGQIPLPMPLRQLSFSGAISEDIIRLDGSTSSLEFGFHFPKDIYLVATMNSVDRSAVPIDSALARRFVRMEISPDRRTLESAWGVSRKEIDVSKGSLTAYEVGILLFDLLNARIASDLGPEFELGHGLFLGLGGTHVQALANADEDDFAWRSLARIWDATLFPQLEDRYSGRPEMITQILRVNESTDSDYLWQFREQISSAHEFSALQRVKAADASLQAIKKSFRFLVSGR